LLWPPLASRRRPHVGSAHASVLAPAARARRCARGRVRIATLALLLDAPRDALSQIVLVPSSGRDAKCLPISLCELADRHRVERGELATGVRELGLLSAPSSVRPVPHVAVSLRQRLCGAVAAHEGVLW